MNTQVSTAQNYGNVTSFKTINEIIRIEDCSGVVGNDNYYARFGIKNLLEIALNPHYHDFFESGVGRGYYLAGVMSLLNIESGRAVDINPKAVELTKKNLKQNEIYKSLNLEVCDYRKYMDLDFLVDLVFFDLPLIPVPKNHKSPYGLKRMIDGGPRGDYHIRKMIEKTPIHLRKKGSIFFVQPDFDDHGTLDLMYENGFEPKVKATKRKYLSETRFTRNLRSYIEEHLGYKFRSGSRGDYFTMKAIHGVKT